jgi:hypothetical protein
VLPRPARVGFGDDLVNAGTLELLR